MVQGLGSQVPGLGSGQERTGCSFGIPAVNPKP